MRVLALIATLFLVPSMALADPVDPPPIEPCKCAPSPAAPDEGAAAAPRLAYLQGDEQQRAKWLSRRRLSASFHRWGTFAAFAGTGALAGLAIYGATHSGSVQFDAGSFPFDVAIATAGTALVLDTASYAVDPGPYRPVPPASALGQASRRVVGYAWRF
jgi:hypothetical protein